MTAPKAMLRASCARKNRLSRLVASSMAAVVRRRSPEPASRMARFRRSSRCSRMKIVKRRIRPAVASGCRMGPTKAPSVVARAACGGRDHHVEGVGAAARSARKIFVLRGRGLQFLAEVLHHVDDARQGSAARSRLLHRGDLLADGDLVARQVGGELARLGGDEQPDPDDRRESRHHHEGRRRGARHHRPPQHAHGGHQDEAEEDRQDHGYDDIAARNTASTRW